MRKLEALPDGIKVNYKGYGLTILGTVDGTTLLLGDNIGDHPFDTNSSHDWYISSLRKFLNSEFLNELAAINPLCVSSDLTAADGDTTLMHCGDRVSLLSRKQYRKYRNAIGECGYPYWTLTAWCPSRSPRCVCTVGPDGSLGRRYASYILKVRPVLALEPSMYISDENELLPLCYKPAPGITRQKGKEK